MLVIGDSITAGFSDGTLPIPLGCQNAFPHVAMERVSEKTDVNIELGLIAFPGITLSAPTQEEADEGAGQGMIDRFFHVWLHRLAGCYLKPSSISFVDRHPRGLTSLQSWTKNLPSSSLH